MSKSLILITVSGLDQPGITAELMNCIMKTDAKIEDMGQSITHGLLSLSFLINVSKNNKTLIKDLLFQSNEMKMQMEYQYVENKQEVIDSGEKYILSCVCLSNITASFIFDVSSTLANHNINIQRIDNITNGEFKSIDFATSATEKNVNWEKVKSELLSISTKHATDMALLKDNVWRRNKRLIVFDMDSTLIKNEVIVEMAKVYGVGDQVHDITEKAMNGEIDFDESLTQRVKLLKGMSENKLEEILQNIELTDGVSDFVKTVKKLGYKIAIISGGFNYFANYFKDTLGLDYAFANDLKIENGILTGNIKGQIVNADKKAILLEMIAQQESINLEQVVAIGDGANDLKMLAKAGLGIAFHAKEIVKQNAEQHMSHGDMKSILYFLGLKGTES